jgi:gliding motility-associated-like protein
MIHSKFFLLILLCWGSLFAQSGAGSCSELSRNPSDYQICSADVNFTSSSILSNENIQPTCFGANLAAPSWFTFKIATSGDVVLEIRQTNAFGFGIDVDFALYGPFSDLDNLCSKITVDNEVDCSYSTSAVEMVTSPISNAGDLYVLIIDNYAARSGQSGPITLSQIGGTGTTDCGFLSNVTIVNTDTTEIVQFNYCEADTKDIMATIDISDFDDNPDNLRFNYTWYKDNVQIEPSTLNDVSSTNTITVVNKGVYKVITSTYDINSNPNQDNPIPNLNEAQIVLNFQTIPEVSIKLNEIPCFNNAPELTATIVNAGLMQSGVDLISYQWFFNGNPITGATNDNFFPEVVGNYFVRVTNGTCDAVDSNIISDITTPVAIPNPLGLEKCNNSGFEVFNLKDNETQISNSTSLLITQFKYYLNFNDALDGNTNYIANPENFTNTIGNYQKIYTRVSYHIDATSGRNCYTILDQELFVNFLPDNTLSDNPYIICLDQLNNISYPAEVNTGLNTTDYSFVWYNNFDAVLGNEILGQNENLSTISNAGEYSVMITDISNRTSCSSVYNFTTTFSLIPNEITATPNDIVGFGDKNNEITASVNPESVDYLFSIDGENWQESNFFSNISAQDHTLVVKNKYGCGTATAMISVINYPRFFTPNGDGHNDVWNIQKTTIFDRLKIQIFNRYGVLLKEIQTDGDGWDGNYNGQLMPATDYWFRLIYFKNNIEKQFKGHFSLKR